MSRSTPLSIGEPAPWFTCRTRSRERYVFDTVAGRTVVLCFFGSGAHPVARQLLAQLTRLRTRFDDTAACFFGVSVDPGDEQRGELLDSIPGVRFFWDTDRSVSARYGVVGGDGSYRPITYVLDAALRVVAALPMVEDAAAHVALLARVLDARPALAPERPAAAQAPVLVVPDVFEPGLCRALIEHYDAHGGEASGFMREVDGKTVLMMDESHKRRSDRVLEDPALCNACMARIHDRLIPEIHKAFQFQATRMERYLVACYDADGGGHFRPHRDNTTKGTAHRRFAVSLFLNSGEYDGGLLRFPEFGNGLHGAPTGGAVVFSCSLLHEATPVTRGRRYMFLPFLYDESARQIRDQNLKFLDTDSMRARGGESNQKTSESTSPAAPLG